MQQSTIDWVAYKLQTVFLKVLLSLGLQTADSSFPPLSAYGGERAGQLSGLFLKGTNPIHKGSTPMTRLPPKGLLNIITLNVRISAYTFQATQTFSPFHF